MTTEEILRNLDQVIAHESGKEYLTGQIRVIDMAQDCKEHIKMLVNRVRELKQEVK